MAGKKQHSKNQPNKKQAQTKKPPAPPAPDKEKKKYSSKLFLVLYIPVLLFTFFKTYDSVFDKKINLGGDNAGYYILGQSLASGQGYTNIHTKQKVKNNHFPPGYPLIISAASKIFSDSIVFIKKINGFFFFLTIAFLFLIVYELTGNYHLPFIVCLFTVVNTALLNFSIIMFSEMSFLFFSTLSLWLLIKTDFKKPIQKNWMFFVLIVAVAFTYHIRSTGLALVAGISLFLLIKKHWKYLAALAGGFGLLCLPWYFRGKNLGGSTYMRKLMMKNPYRPEEGTAQIADWLERFWNNLERYITREIPAGTFNYVEVTNYKEPIEANEWLIGICILIVMIFGVIKLKKYATLFLLYIVATFGILLLWPDVWFGVRFLVPLVPLLFFLFVYGMTETLVWVGNKTFKIKKDVYVLVPVAIISLFVLKSYVKPLDKLKKKAETPYSNNFQNYFDLARHIRQNAHDSSVTCCRKEKLFYLYAHKYVTNYKRTPNREEIIEDLIKKEVDYVVLEQLGYSSTWRYLYPAVQKYPAKFKMVKHLKNPDTYLMEFKPELGYWGEWKEDKKHGKGIFAWENGRKFEGEWRNDKRNGFGILTFPDGSSLHAKWTDDKINGEAQLKNKNGETIEKAIYKDNQKIRVFQ